VPTSTILHFLQAGCPSCHPTNSVKALKATSALTSIKVVTNVTESQVNTSTDQDAGVADEVGAVTEVSQVGLHHSFHLIMPQVVERLHERCGRQKQSAATCITAELAATSQINDTICDSAWECLQCFNAVC